MKVYIYKKESILFGETLTKVIPCISKEVAKSYLDFDKEEIMQLDRFQESGDIYAYNNGTKLCIDKNEWYFLSITEEEVKEKSAWEE